MPVSGSCSLTFLLTQGNAEAEPLNYLQGLCPADNKGTAAAQFWEIPLPLRSLPKNLRSVPCFWRPNLAADVSGVLLPTPLSPFSTQATKEPTIILQRKLTVALAFWSDCVADV